MGETLIILQAGSPVVVTSALTFLGTGSAGDPAACRRLVFPAAVSPLLAPIVYAVTATGICLNPTRTFNLDNKVLPHPTTSVVKTIGGTRVVRFEEGDEDVVVTEIWQPTGGASLPTFFLRLLYEYVINAALIPGGGPDFIRWEPRDRTDRIYDVELLSLSVGGGAGERRFDVADIRADRGVIGDFDNALAGLNTAPTGLIDVEVQLRMRIVAEV